MNILLIMADQFAAHALARSRSTDAHFKTPNLDRLASVSTVFTQAYTPFPLCVPARSSMITGKYPHQLGIMNNKSADAAPRSEPGHGSQSLGHWFTAAGYDCAYAGKWHALQASASVNDGFAPIHPFGDEGLVEACHDWLGQRSGERPFLLVASFDDPHTICEYARSQPMPYGDVPAAAVAEAPPLPANFYKAPYASEAPAMEQVAAARLYGTAGFSPDDWRSYRATYAALVQRVDQRIGQLLDGIDVASTSVIFVSDHGDGDASHGWNQKTALYQECIKVPFLVQVPGRPAAVVTEPVAAVLGLLPTLCEIAGIQVPEGLAAPSALQRDGNPVVVETAFADAAALPGARTSGRALILGHWKYTVYGWGQYREQLHDLAADPQEQRNLAVENAFAPELERMRTELLRWCEETGDTAFRKRLVLPKTAPAGKHQEIFRVPY
ncbi:MULTISPECIES: sulfatase family protein [Arthrobacter]|uniref:Sulfatase n=1 Tax=Arthrobacter psychrochitiniphilus TaxID=291045 RepID=A0A2V3DWA1_9MICC|nr:MULTISPECIES: sulfatase-like hydrolase/transferase [Arthrobacter]NYG16253.1 arylsulfatase A-like enzyme [Arthrobacter psychrochitiniphilus]PXA69569.1 sulfatase [Arthrobacter psychrochitiniphilus]